MSSSPQLSSTTIITTLRRYHPIIFIVVLLVGLMAVVLLLNNVVVMTTKPADLPQTGLRTSFDQATIDRIKQLRTSAEPSQPLDFSAGRISPFSE